ncbi:GNAT family N-acetyltransferase [Tistrella mobilis]|uniref:GNAT family N-acetyltransferase n=1 Tax=Tistrella mobilis TaxID=171437 RepID=UPI003557DC7E
MPDAAPAQTPLVTPLPVPVIRPLVDADADGLIALIDLCWSAYPGCVLDVDAELPELRHYASHVGARGGAAWVAVAGGDPAAPATADTILASCAVMAAEGEPVGHFELFKLYVSPRARRSGLARRMLVRAIEHARDAGSRHLMLWTDTRFTEGHAFYEAQGFTRGPLTRALHDLSRSVEYRYDLPLGSGA